MRAALLRTYLGVHTWVGIVGGFALFVAFLGGALTMFHHEIERWEQPAARHHAATMADAETLSRLLRARYPATRDGFGIVLPDHAAQPFAYWQQDGEWQHARLSTDAGGQPTLLLGDPVPGLSDLLDSLHYSLAIPTAGIYLMGVVSLLYGLALVSGVIVHLPRLAQDLFALRPGKNKKRFWQDMHNAIGVLSLPFHIVFAITGAVLCLGVPLIMVFNLWVFPGKLAAEVPAITGAVPARVAGVAGAPQPLPVLVERARAAAPGLVPSAIYLTRYGQPDGVAEVMGDVNRSLGTFSAVAVRLNDGAVIGEHQPGARDVNHATRSMIFGVHFGNYGGWLVRWLYFGLGVAGALLVYSGNLLWIESRRKRHSMLQPRTVRVMAKATVGVFLGTCAGMAAAFVGALVAPGTAALHVFIGVLAASMLLAACTVPALGAVLLLIATALLCLAIPLFDALLTPDNLVHSIVSGDGVLAGVDAMALAAALLFAWLARVGWRRARRGDPHSVWAYPARASAPARPAQAVDERATTTTSLS